MIAQLLVAATITLGAPAAPPLDAWHVVIYDDDPVRGAQRCQVAELLYAPATCEVQPTSAAPDPNQPGWAR